ncbi:MAG: flagellar hook-length control protein FliK, partial [Kiritimatiellae bacterium]|nr:flagellar hook-length control protein FliK [Kiritimatiellia bacterium]
QLESGFVARREGEGMTEPAFSTVGVEPTPPPRTVENPVNPVKEDVPVQTIEVNSDGLKKELHYRSAPRVAPDSRVSIDVLRTVENPAHPVQAEVPAQPIERQLESGFIARREGEVVTEPAFSTVGVETTPQPRTVEAPVEKNVVPQVRARSEHPVDEPDAPTVLAAAPVMPPLVERTIPAESAAVQKVAAAQSARTEAVNAAVARAVETVNALVETVVAEIAVTPALARGDGEIRITLKPTVLDGSELHLSAKAGELTVSIAPATAEAAHVIQQNLPRLETALAEHAPAFRHVAVVIASAKKGKINETA